MLESKLNSQINTLILYQQGFLKVKNGDILKK